MVTEGWLSVGAGAARVAPSLLIVSSGVTGGFCSGFD